ncbi:MAG: amidase [Erythrobacter sp.]
MIVTPASLGAGPLRVVVKDSINVAGIRTGMGSKVYEKEAPAEKHAEIVERVIASGARIIGKANMHELAFGVTGVNEHFGTPENPSYPELIPGGSSSGSAAAVAAGIAEIGLGTDTGGSIRMPAACCGIVGLKPSYGRISRNGVIPAESSLDCAGPFARNVEMIERALAMIAPDYKPHVSEGDFTLGVVSGPWSVEIDDAFAHFLSTIDASIMEVELPNMAAAHAAGLTLIGAENWSAFGHIVDHPGLGDDIRARLSKTRDITAKAVADAETVRAQFTAQVDRALSQVDALVLPAMPATAPTLAEAQDPATIVGHTSMMRPFNLSGHPAIVLPFETEAGLPFGIQLVGKKMHDEQLCAVAKRVEAGMNAEPVFEETKV